MGDFSIRVADAFGFENPHVVGPDIGAAVPLQLGSLLKDWVEAPDLGRFHAADPREVVAGALSGIQRYVLPGPVRKDYLSSYDGDRFVESMRYVRSYPAELPALRDLLAQVQTPVQIIAGGRDTGVPPVNAEFLHERLPPQQARHHRRGALHLGRRRRPVRRTGHELVEQRLRGRLNYRNSTETSTKEPTMAVAVIVDIPGGNQQIYEQLTAKLLRGGKLPDGWQLHLAGPTADGWRIINVVPSQEQFEAFAREKLFPAVQQAENMTPQLAFLPV